MQTLKQDTVQFGLSEEELLALMAYMGATNLQGIDATAFQTAKSDELQRSMDVATRALVARGFLVAGAEQKLSVERIVFATVGACVWPDFSISIYRAAEGKPPEEYYINVSRQMHVVHSILAKGIHQFTAMEDHLALGRVVLSIVAAGHYPCIEAGSATIPMRVLAEARAAAAKGQASDAETVLSREKVKPTLARELAITLAAPTANITINISGASAGASSGIGILQGTNAQWMILPVTSEGGEWSTVTVHGMSEEEFTRQVRSWLGF
jgi:hypothetical protein